MAEDARIRKTKEKLTAAFVELLKEQPFDEITPAKLCERAGINRSTFYRNYRNLSQLRAEIEDNLLESVEWDGKNFDPVESRKKILAELNFLKENSETFTALTSGGFQDSIFEKMSERLLEGAMAHYGKHAARIAKELYVFECTFYISAGVGIIYKWHQSGMTTPAPELADFITERLEAVIEKYQ